MADAPASQPRIVRADTYFAVAALEDHIASIDDALNDARLSGGAAEVARLERTRADAGRFVCECALRRDGERQLLIGCRRIFMKQLMLVCLLAMSAAAFADDARRADQPAKREAEEAKTRAKLEEARARLDKAAREVAELSTQLGAHARHDIRVIEGGPRRAVLGIQVDPNSDKKGVRVLSVSPGGPAAEAGLRDSDVIIALDGVPTTGGDPDRALIEQMRKVKPEQKVKVRVLRDGKNKDLTVVARPMAFDERMFNVRLPEGAMGAMVAWQLRQHARTCRWCSTSAPSFPASSAAWSSRASRRSSAPISV